jgi:hypothetical protein
MGAVVNHSPRVSRWYRRAGVTTTPNYRSSLTDNPLADSARLLGRDVAGDQLDAYLSPRKATRLPPPAIDLPDGLDSVLICRDDGAQAGCRQLPSVSRRNSADGLAAGCGCGAYRLIHWRGDVLDGELRRLLPMRVYLQRAG